MMFDEDTDEHCRLWLRYSAEKATPQHNYTYIFGPYNKKQKDGSYKFKPVNLLACIAKDDTLNMEETTHNTKSSALGAVTEAIKENPRITTRDIALLSPEQFVRHSRGLMALKEALKPDEDIEADKIDLYDWQIQLISTLKEPPQKRRIIWIWSKLPGLGKTTFLEHLQTIPDMHAVSLDGDETNWNNIAMTYLNYEKTTANKPRVIMIDLPRANVISDCQMKLWENICGWVTKACTKYEGGTVRIKSHILITSNMPPPVEKMPMRFFEIKLRTKGRFIITDHIHPDEEIHDE